MKRPDGYTYALAALRFFGFPGGDQIDAERRQSKGHQPAFFTGSSGSQRDSDFFFGVACVFKTYQGHLLDRIPSGKEASSAVNRLAAQINVVMHGRNAADWSESAVLNSEIWRRFRREANDALQELDETLPNEAPILEIASLVNPDEFNTSNEAKRLLE